VRVELQLTCSGVAVESATVSSSSCPVFPAWAPCFAAGAFLRGLGARWVLGFRPQVAMVWW